MLSKTNFIGKTKATFIVIFALVFIIGFVVNACAVSLSSEKTSQNNIISISDEELTPPWADSGAWKKEWTDLLGRTDANVYADEEYGKVYLKANAGLFGKAKADGHFFHQNYFDEYVCPEDGFYDVVFTYQYVGELECLIGYIHGRGDSFVETDIKVSFIVYVEDDQDSYKSTLDLDKDAEYRLPGEEIKWDETEEIVVSNVYMKEGKKVSFTARADVELYSVSGGVCAYAKVNINLKGYLKKISIRSNQNSDINSPFVKITKPERAIYRDNVKKSPFFITIIRGAIDVEVDASDSESGVDKIEFYVDDRLKFTDEDAPYVWYWDETYKAQCELLVKAYDNCGNVNYDRIPVIYINS